MKVIANCESALISQVLERSMRFFKQDLTICSQTIDTLTCLPKALAILASVSMLVLFPRSIRAIVVLGTPDLFASSC